MPESAATNETGGGRTFLSREPSGSTRIRGSSELLAFLSLAVLYLCMTIGTFNYGYIDFGDGNYLYISERMAEGVVLYRDIVSPQPPVHLLIGSKLIGLSRSLGLSIQGELALVRVYLALLHVLTMFILWRIARHLFNEPFERILGITLFLFLPNTYLWSRGYQSENHEIVFLYASFLFLLWENRAGLVLAGVMSVLGIFTNMTYAPYLVLFVLYVLICRRREWAWFFVPLVTGILTAGALAYVASDGHYVENVFTNQVGTFPKENLGRYILKKLLGEGGDLLRVEGGFIIPALLGLVVLAGDRAREAGRKFPLWFSLFAMGSILFVSKGGTMEYIFVLGEPMVALLAGHFLFTVVVGSGFDLGPATWRRSRSLFVLRVFVTIFVAATLFYQSVFHLAGSLSQDTYENPEAYSERVVDLIDKYTDPGDLILAPPYYAYLSGRVLSGEMSSTYMWYIRYMHAQGSGSPDPVVDREIDRIVDDIESGRVTLVLLNMGQLGQIPEIRRAVEENLVEIPAYRIQSLNEVLRFYVRPEKAAPRPAG